MSHLILLLIISLQVFTPAYCPFEADDTLKYTIEAEEKSENFNSTRLGFCEFHVSDSNGTHVFFRERKVEYRQGYSFGKPYSEVVELVTYETIRIRTRQNKFGLHAWHWINPSDCFQNATIPIFSQKFVVINNTFLPRINKTVWFLRHKIVTQEENFEDISQIIAAYESTFGYLAYYQALWQRTFLNNKQDDKWFSNYNLWLNSTNATFSLEQLSLVPIVLTGAIIVVLSVCTSVILIYYVRKRKRRLI